MVSERQKQAYEMPAPARKITEDLRARALRRVDGQLVPSVTKDTEIRGFALVVTTRRAFWCLFFQPKGVNLTTGQALGWRRAPRARRRLRNVDRRRPLQPR